MIWAVPVSGDYFVDFYFGILSLYLSKGCATVVSAIFCNYESMNYVAVAQIFIQICLYHFNVCQCQRSGDITLVGGASSIEGRVEVYFGGRWGTICDDLWNDKAATVVCRQLGLGDNGTAVFQAEFGRGSGTIWLDNVECSGSESNLQECSYPGLGLHNCDHTEDAGVYCIKDGEIRLRNGLSSNDGRVEIFHDGQWGTVCHHGWDWKDAAVVCRQLGFNGSADAFGSAKFGQGSDMIWLDNVECTGSESTLRECINTGWNTNSCNHYEDAGVRCETDDMNDGLSDIRLRNGFASNEGRVEVFHDGQWGTVCDDGWGDSDAAVVCRQLGFNGTASAFWSATFGEGSGSIWLDNVECIGTEETLQECTNPGWGIHDCGHFEDAGVRCVADGMENEILLRDGLSPSEGRVEIFHDGQWGTVCDNGWDVSDATVLCHQLGFNGSAAALGLAAFGEGSGPIWLDNVECNGNEESLQECTNLGWGTHNCGHSQDAGVRCELDVTEKEIRLSNGFSPNDGRVEIFHDGRWGTVCDDGWDDSDAAVVCRQLGFTGSATAYLSAAFGPGRGTIWLDNVECTGNEISLVECTNPGWGIQNCGHYQDAGVRCNNDDTENVLIRLVGGSYHNEGRVEVYINGRWGTVCDDGWDDKDAVVVCRQLGFKTGGTAISDAAFGKGSGDILLDHVDCSGEEGYLTDCRSTRIAECDHGEDAGVRCNDIRLTYGVGMSEGRVEVYFDGQWGTVCDDSWNNVTAQVVCRQLGFSPGGTAVLRSFFGSTTRMRRHDIRCTGKETSLLHCENAGWSYEKCHSAEDVGVSCTEVSDTKSCFNVPCLNGGTCIKQSYGYVCVCLNGFYGNTCETEKPGITSRKPKGFAVFISFVCLLLVGAIVYLAVWIRRIKYSLDSQALSPIEMQKRNTDNKSVESNRNDYKRREMSNTHSENSKDLYVNEELYEAV